MGAKLLRHHPFVDEVLETPDALSDTLGAACVLARELRHRGISPDCILTGASDNQRRTGLLALMAGIGWRGGYSVIPQLYQSPLAYDASHSLIENNLRLARLIGCNACPREPQVFFTEADVAAARAMVGEVNLAGKGLVVMVTQGSGGQSTGWHRERFVQVARAVTEEFGCALAYVGTAGDGKAIEELRVAAGGVGVSLAGRTSVTELAALLAMSDYMVSLDTGTMHLGRAVGLPLVVIAPTWQKAVEWLPIGVPAARILRGPDRDDIPPGYRLDEVSAEDAIEALRELMAVFPASSEARAARVSRCLSEVDHLAR
jgi:ADP-heptose:LPS heptosyltransferase